METRRPFDFIASGLCLLPRRVGNASVHSSLLMLGFIAFSPATTLAIFVYDDNIH